MSNELYVLRHSKVFLTVANWPWGGVRQGGGVVY